MVEGLEEKLNQEEASEVDNQGFFNKMTDWYFRPKSFERSGKLYESLGIKQFKKFVPSGDYSNRRVRKTDPNHRIIEGVESARSWDRSSRIFEGIHLVFGGGIVVPLIIDHLNKRYYIAATISTALNIVVNVYPLMLQRYNRSRIYNLLDRIEKRTE